MKDAVDVECTDDELIVTLVDGRRPNEMMSILSHVTRHFLSENLRSNEMNRMLTAAAQ